MLHAEIREAEEKWIIYDDEYTEVNKNNTFLMRIYFNDILLFSLQKNC